MSFETRRFRDIEVVVNTSDSERPINLTKLASTLTGHRQAFKEIVRRNKGLFELIDSYISPPEDQILMGAKTPTNNQASQPRDLKWLVDEEILVEISGKPNWRAGIYGPTYLADWIVINCCPKFFKQIHDLFEVVEKTVNLKNSTFETEIAEITSQKNREIERLTSENKDLISRVDDLIKKLDLANNTLAQVRNENRETHERLDRANTSLDIANANLNIANANLDIANTNLNIANNRIQNLSELVIEIRDQSSRDSAELVKQINEKFADSRVTTGSSKEVLLIIESRKLTNSLANEENGVFDTISCQYKDINKHLKTHNFDETNDRIIRTYKTSNAIDLEYFAKTHLAKSQGSIFSNERYRRKLIYRQDFKDELLKRLDGFIEAIPNARIEILQTIENNQSQINSRIERRLDELEARVEETEARVEAVEERLSAIEEVARLAINQFSINLPNRNRRLRVYIGRDGLPYVNLNKSRHYLTENECKYGLDNL